MSFLHVHSCECAKTELELFTLPPTQTTIESSQWVHYKPISSLTDNSPIEFVVQGQEEEYIDLAHTILRLCVGITRRSPVIASAHPPKVAPINNFMHSIFSQVDVLFNQKPVSTPNNLYPYRAYIETLLNYGADAKKSHLTTVGWCCDTPGKMDSLTDENLGLKKQRFLINGVEMQLRLMCARDAFCLMDDTVNGCVYNISDASLLVRRAKISPGTLLAHAPVSMAAGVHGETMDNILHGQIPRRLITGFVDNKAFNGDASMNPFNFQNFGINYLSLYVDGRQIPSKSLQPDFGNRMNYIDAYHTLFSGTGIHFLKERNSIDRFDYPNGYCLYAFDLTPDLSANSNTHWNLIKHGTVRIEVRFDKALATVTGRAQKSYLESLLCRPVINIEDLQDSPSVSTLHQPRLTCALHSVLESRRNRSLGYNQCALSCADLLKQWLSKKVNSEAGENIDEPSLVCPWGCEAYNEHGAGLKSYSVYTIPHDWSVSCGQDPENLD
uniref:Uncharacterized protein n=1 Tax=Cotesia sesamiae Mombasa bracovirus TaxID=452649 RepID=R9XLG5_9VIRU|nr:hypothetical protein CsmBAC4b19.1 [Cotesia sesamiae] [Cotesia sesamiae Mombasa bracovirus]